MFPAQNRKPSGKNIKTSPGTKKGSSFLWLVFHAGCFISPNSWWQLILCQSVTREDKHGEKKLLLKTVIGFQGLVLRWFEYIWIPSFVGGTKLPKAFKWAPMTDASRSTVPSYWKEGHPSTGGPPINWRRMCPCPNVVSPRALSKLSGHGANTYACSMYTHFTNALWYSNIW